MGCRSCKTKISGVCKVCELVGEDNTVKDVKYCNMCGVYICTECNGDLEKRWSAFLKLRIGV